MSQPYRRTIPYPAAWIPAEIGGKAGITRKLSPAEIAAFEEVVSATRTTPPDRTTRVDFDHPALTPLYDELRRTITDGAGAAIVAGLSPERFGEDGFTRIFWGVGTQLGDAAEQNIRGDRIGRVEKDDNPKARGYRSDAELTPHTDTFETAGLMCVRRAESGGLSSVASTLAIHNEILKSRPELLDPLYEGYYYAINELRDSARPVTEVKVPVFCNVGGKVSCTIIEGHMRNAAPLKGVVFPADLDAALTEFKALAVRPDIRLNFMLEPGEMIWLNNLTTIHARTNFVNSAEHRRLLLRLWLNAPEARPVTPALRARVEAYHWHFAEQKKLQQPASAELTKA